MELATSLRQANFASNTLTSLIVVHAFQLLFAFGFSSCVWHWAARDIQFWFDDGEWQLIIGKCIESHSTG